MVNNHSRSSSAIIDHCKAFDALGPDPLDLYGMHSKNKGSMYTTNQRSSRSSYQEMNTPLRGVALKNKTGNKRKR